MPFIDSDLHVSQDQWVRDVLPDAWFLEENLTYQGKDTTFLIPKNTVTDFATVPRFLQWLVPRTGRYNRAVVVHDFFCESLAWDDPPLVSSRDADGIFRRILREEGVRRAERWLIWTGVRWGAAFTKSRRKDVHKDLPAMLGLSVVFLPVVLPGVLGVGIGLGLNRLLGLLAR